MKSLENIVDLQEMNLQEMNEVNGGIIPVAVMLGIWAYETAVCTTLLAIYASRK